MATRFTSLRDSTFGIWLLLTAGPALADQAPAWREDSRAPGRLTLGLHLVDGQGLSDGTRRAVRAEIERIFQGSGVDVRTVVSRHPVVESPGFPVVRVRLWSRDGTFLGSGRSAMGSVRISRRRKVVSAHVFYPVIIATLLDRDESIEDLSERTIGRAVGRVIAHELMHAVSPQVPHTRFGLMRAAMDEEFLSGLHLTPIAGPSAKAFRRQVRIRSQTRARSDPATTAR